MTDCAVLDDQSAYTGIPFAAQADIAQAAVALEVAIGAGSAIGAASALTDCAAWLGAAAGNYATTHQPGMAHNAACAADQAAMWAAASASWGDLATFQRNTLLPFHSVLRGLGADNDRLAAADSSVILWSCLGLGLLVITVDSFQQHGVTARPAHRRAAGGYSGYGAVRPAQQRAARRDARDHQGAGTYISRIRNENKKRYANAYYFWRLEGQIGEEPPRSDFGDLSYMAAQAVRMDIDRMVPRRANGGHTRHTRREPRVVAEPRRSADTYMGRWLRDNASGREVLRAAVPPPPGVTVARALGGRLLRRR